MAFLLDPKVFNYIILGLFALSAVRWAFAGAWIDVVYWVSSFALTATVTFGFKH